MKDFGKQVLLMFLNNNIFKQARVLTSVLFILFSIQTLP